MLSQAWPYLFTVSALFIGFGWMTRKGDKENER